MLGGPFEDTSVPWETKGRMLDTLLVAMAGAAAERCILGEHTSGCENDYDTATAIAMRFIKAGFGGPDLCRGEDGLPHGYLTSDVKTRTIVRIQELVADAEVRADALIAENEGGLIFVATAVYEQRRIADDRLNAVLEAAGFTLPRATA